METRIDLPSRKCKLFIQRALETCSYWMIYKVIFKYNKTLLIFYQNYVTFSDISEADLIYTETLMQRGVEDYKDKEIVILGRW